MHRMTTLALCVTLRRSRLLAFASLLLCVPQSWAEPYTIPLLGPPGASGDPQGVLRILNATAESGMVEIYAIDDSGARTGPATFTLNASAAAEFTATDLQSGNAALGLAGGIGTATGDARVEIETDLDIVPLAFMRAADGTLSAMHDTVRGARAGDGSGGYAYEVPVFNPSTETVQASRLRLINPGDSAAAIAIAGRDDTGAPASGGGVTLTLAAGAAKTLTAQQLEAGDGSVAGRLGAGVGKWRLTVSSDRTLEVVNIVVSNAGYWSNLSTTAARGAAPPDLDAFAERFEGRNIVQETDAGISTFTPMADGRFTETDGSSGATVADMGDYGYAAIGPEAGRLILDYDGGHQCRANLYFSTRTSGWFASHCTATGDPEGRRTGGTWSLGSGEVDAGDGAVMETGYAVDDALPGVPTSGAFTPTITGGGSILPTGAGTTIVLNNEAYFELSDGTRYTCAAPDGCTIANGTVIAGAVTGRAAGAGEVGRFPGECRVGMTLSSGQSCTYPGAAAEFSVNARGRGSFLGRLAGIRIRIDNETVDGRVYDFEASHQGEGIWRIDRIAGGTGTDTSPSFANGSRTGNQTYTVGTAIDTLTLPEASGGDGALTYSLSPNVPGLAFNGTTRRLTGTPTVAANYNMTYSVKDRDGDTDTLTFSIIVQGSATGGNTDRAVLVALYNATNGPNWRRRDNWLTDAPIGAWHGVTVSDGRVVSLSLYNNGLSGTIPPELGNLTRLVHLDLGFNDLTGPIPPELGELKSLEDLYLGSNALSGWIPPALGNLTRLGVLSLEFNTLTGPIPRELGNLPRLRILSLWINQLTGSIPQELGNLTLLEELWLSGNALTGSIPPELGQLLNLRYLDLADTSLTGTIPTDFASLRNLELVVPGGVCVPTDLLEWAVERRVSAFTCTPEGRLLPSALIREDGNGLSLALPGDLREPSAVTVSDSSVVAASVANGWLELLPRGLGEAEVVLVPSGGGAPANARVVVRAAVGTFGIDIVMDRPAPVTYEEALMVGADWWSSVLDGTEWPDRRPGCFNDRATALADELLIHARVDSETDAAGYALTCFRNDGNQAALDPGGGAIVAAPQSGNPYLVRHEIGHLLGLVFWGPESGLVVNGEENLYFTGEQALSAFHAAGGDPGLPGVPFDGVHWAFGVDDFMGTGLHGTVSAAALADSGYTANIEKATDALGWSDRDLGNGQALSRISSVEPPTQQGNLSL